MDPPFSGFVLDPSKCRKLSIEEKRELVHELSKWPESAPEKLQTWSRRDLLEILCAEMGKERKYTGLTKQKLIEHLFRVVSAKKSGEHVEDIDSTPHPPPSNPQTPSKRQRKTDNPSRLPIATNNHLTNDDSESPKDIRYCQNLVCKAILSLEDAFCKRCSCCICHKYDDNKDPSLWLVCSSEIPSEGDPCGLSCHLECALKHEKAGIVKKGQCTRLDGSYYCTCCGKVNDLLRCWRKQLMIAKDARRVDVLCYRLSLSHKLLHLSEKYHSLHQIVDTAMRKLETDVGPINGLPNMARGIVNRLSVGAEVQRLCVSAIESLDSLLSGASSAQQPILVFAEASRTSSSFIKLEEITSTSVTVVLGSEDNEPSSQELVGYTLWHRKADTMDFPTEPTGTLYKTKRRFPVADLTPATEYVFRLVAFGNTRELGMWETGAITKDLPRVIAKSCGSPKTNSSGLSNPSSEGDESNSTAVYGDLSESPNSYSGSQDKPESKDTEQDETPGNSGSILLDEEPNSTINTESHKDSTNSTDQNQVSDVPKFENESNAPHGNEAVLAALPVTPCKLETGNKPKPSSSLLENGPSKPEKEPGNSLKKRALGGPCEDRCIKDGSSTEGDYEYCVKVIRWLECEGHIESNFRVKFLTWFSLRASPQERRVVSVFVDTMIDDPGSLAGQLMDTFLEAVCSKRPPPVPNGFCMKLWH